MEKTLKWSVELVRASAQQRPYLGKGLNGKMNSPCDYAGNAENCNRGYREFMPFQKSLENRINTLCLAGVFKKPAL